MTLELGKMGQIARKVVAALAVVGASLTCAILPSGHVFGQSDTAPNIAITLLSGYRDWCVVSVAHEAGKLNDLRAVLGNDLAINAYRNGDTSFPDGAILARLAWAYTPSEENNKAFGQEQSFVAGAPTNVQLMVKDEKRFASTGGWGFAQFTDGRPAPAASLKACYSCHIPAKPRDYVFTRYAP